MLRPLLGEFLPELKCEARILNGILENFLTELRGHRLPPLVDHVGASLRVHFDPEDFGGRSLQRAGEAEVGAHIGGAVAGKVDLGPPLLLNTYVVERVVKLSVVADYCLPFEKAPIWYALSVLYEEESDNANPILAQFYNEMFAVEVERGMELSSKPFAFETDVIGCHEYRRDELPLGWPDTVDVNGTSYRVGWPKRGFWS